MTDVPFLLAMASLSGSPEFPIVVLDDEAAISLHALTPLAARLGHGLTGTHSVFGLLQDWQRNFTGLRAAVTALADPALGKYTRSQVTALEFYELLSPIPYPRQVFLFDGQSTCLPVSALAGPKAKVPMPPDQSFVQGGLALAAVVGAPTYRANAEEINYAFAGMMVATQYQDQTGLIALPAPGYLPTGPYFVPNEHCPSELSGRISFNGETGIDGSLQRQSVLEAIGTVASRNHLFPGDLIIVPMGAAGSVALGDGDIVETAIAGLGQQTTNIMKESKYADTRN